MFISPEKQIDLFLQWNSTNPRGLQDHHLKKALAHLTETLPAEPSEKLCAVVLDVSLQSIRGTHAAAVDFLVRRNPKMKENHLDAIIVGEISEREKGGRKPRLLGPRLFTPFSCQWRVIDFGANRGCSPRQVRNPEKSPASALYFAGAFHTEWITAMDGDKVPYVWVAGYRYLDAYSNAPKKLRFSNVPDIGIRKNFGPLTVSLRGALREYESYPDYAVPEYVS